jgi:hypothetical protein
MQLRKLILLIIAQMLFASTVSLVFAQQKPQGHLPKMRAVKIYLYRSAAENRPEIPGRLVPVRREIFDYKLLEGSLKALLEGTTEKELSRNLRSFIHSLELYSARIRNQTAEINFVYDQSDIDEKKLWTYDPMRSHFIEAVERTARQFPNVKRVSICVEGYADFINPNRQKRAKCPFETFSPSPPRRAAVNELREVDIYLDNRYAPVTEWGARLPEPVKRLVNARSFLTEALKALVAGETETERKHGYGPVAYGAQFVSVHLKDKKALARFTMPAGAKFPNENTRRVFYYAVEETLSQFYNEVAKVEVCLDGVRNFYEPNGTLPEKCEQE